VLRFFAYLVRHVFAARGWRVRDSLASRPSRLIIGALGAYSSTTLQRRYQVNAAYQDGVRTYAGGLSRICDERHRRFVLLAASVLRICLLLFCARLLRQPPLRTFNIRCLRDPRRDCTTS